MKGSNRCMICSCFFYFIEKIVIEKIVIEKIV